jgi:hypothetical protein
MGPQEEEERLAEELARGDDVADPDPIDEEAATIDARGDDAERQIEELEEHAERLGREDL